MSDSDDTAKRLTALAAMLSRGAPLPDDFPSLPPDRPVAVDSVRPEPIPAEPAGSAGRRMEKPIEVDERTGAVRVRGYRRKPKAGWLDWSVPINDRDE